MVKIESLSIRNYRSLKEIAAFDLRPLNIMIGPNGSGKSNFLSFLRLLARAADGELRTTIRQMGGYDEIRWRGQPDAAIEWAITFVEPQRTRNTQRLYYAGSLARQGKNSFAIVKEELSRDPYPGKSQNWVFLGAYDGRLRLRPRAIGRDESEAEETVAEYNDQEFAIAQYTDVQFYPALADVRLSLLDWTIFRGFGENALANIAQAQDIDDKGDPLRLRPDGSNLVAVLHALKNESRYGEAFEQLEDRLSGAFPDFKQLDVPAAASGKAELRWRPRQSGWESFPAHSLSDGMLRFLGLATLLVLPDPPPLIAIDEPEIGLHPKMIPLLAGLLKSASARTQIVVTTHSPQLLSAEAIDLDDIVLVNAEGGETQFERPDSAQLNLWLQRYTIGEMWLMDKLHG